ncbi:hypothetical protein EDD85DRAFT_773152, partial [Armillaria nabsnona]
DAAVKQILLAMNERQTFIIEDLDDNHLLIKQEMEYYVRKELEAEASRRYLPNLFRFIISYSWRRIHIAWKLETYASSSYSYDNHHRSRELSGWPLDAVCSSSSLSFVIMSNSWADVFKVSILGKESIHCGLHSVPYTIHTVISTTIVKLCSYR